VLEEVVVVADLLLALLQIIGLCERGEPVADLRIVREIPLDRRLERQLRVARERDDPEERARPRAGLVLEEGPVQGLDHLLQEPLRLLGVEDRERPREADRLAVHPEGAVAYRVECPAPEALGLDPGQLVTRCSISLAALLVKVSSRISPGRTPWERSQATR
jgi:hypothetical protein